MPDVVHVCPRLGELRATGHCGTHHRPTVPHCGRCGHDLTQPGHEAHT